MSKKLDPMEDPKYFEYEPKMLEDDEDEIHLSMYELGVKPGLSHQRSLILSITDIP